MIKNIKYASFISYLFIQETCDKFQFLTEPTHPPKFSRIKCPLLSRACFLQVRTILSCPSLPKQVSWLHYFTVCITGISCPQADLMATKFSLKLFTGKIKLSTGHITRKGLKLNKIISIWGEIRHQTYHYFQPCWLLAAIQSEQSVNSCLSESKLDQEFSQVNPSGHTAEQHWGQHTPDTQVLSNWVENHIIMKQNSIKTLTISKGSLQNHSEDQWGPKAGGQEWHHCDKALGGACQGSWRIF